MTAEISNFICVCGLFIFLFSERIEWYLWRNLYETGLSWLSAYYGKYVEIHWISEQYFSVFPNRFNEFLESLVCSRLSGQALFLPLRIEPVPGSSSSFNLFVYLLQYGRGVVRRSSEVSASHSGRIPNGACPESPLIHYFIHSVRIGFSVTSSTDFIQNGFSWGCCPSEIP